MKFIPDSVTRSFSRAVLQSKKNSPHIFFAVGLVGVVGSTILACRATLKLEETLDEIKEDLDEAKRPKALIHEAGTEILVPTEIDRTHALEMGRVYFSSAAKVGRLYGPAIVVGTASVVLLTGSHVQMTKRNSALTTTLALVSQAFGDYRLRVQDAIGSERELDIYHNVNHEKVDVDGIKEIVKVVDPNKLSLYSRFFDECSPNWTKDPEMNRVFIQCQQNYANHLLQVRGHVFLNEVYDSLGMERSQAGQVVGWVMAGEGDNFIDFGMFEAHNNRFVNGIERSILLDFNVDGVVYDKI